MKDCRLLGIDAGTTSLKAVLYNGEGKQLSSATREYRLITPKPTIVEASPEIYWESLKAVMEEITMKLGASEINVDALAISSQGESFVVLDKSGNPLRNVIVWLDSRAREESDIIRNEFGRENVYHTTGSPDVDPIWASTKLLWMRRNEPDNFNKIHKVLFVEDYLINQMTKEYAANGSLYCSSLLFDIIRNKWWQNMLDFLNINEEQLANLYPSGVVIGHLTEQARKDLKIATDAAVVTAGMDQACGCIGTGNISSGILTENIGASLNVCVTNEKPIFDKKMRVPCQTHSVNGKYMYVPWTKSGGIILKWFKDNFCEKQIEESERLEKNIYDILTKNIKNIPPGSNSIIMLPHLTGAVSPEMNDLARGVFYGLNLSSDRDILVRSIIESITYVLRSNIELVEEENITIKTVISSGGASNSEIWNQIKADVLGFPIRTIKNQDSGCLGAAILSGVGVGFFKSIEDACDVIIKKGKDYYPNERNVKIYDQYYHVYKDLYTRLEPVFERSAEILSNIERGE